MTQDAHNRPLATLIRSRREALGITLSAMVTRLKARRLNVSDSSLSRWENGESTPLEVYLTHIAAAYRLPQGVVRKAWLQQKGETP